MKKTEIYKNLGDLCINCEECPLGSKLVDNLNPHVFSNGNIDSKVIFIGEAPGYEETVLSQPFVGRSGRFFNEEILTVLEKTREEIYTTNVVKCRPAGNRNPLPAEIELCRPILDAEICLIDPELIVILGNIALNGICGINGGITKLHGTTQKSRKWSNDKEYNVFPLYHPSFVLRGNGYKEIKEDAEKLKKLIEEIWNY